MIVVEGKDDITAVKRAVQAEIIATNGYGFPRYVKERIKKAAETKGIIVLTDPDYAGERIRGEVTKLVKNCKHAFITQEEGLKNGDIRGGERFSRVDPKGVEKSEMSNAGRKTGVYD